MVKKTVILRLAVTEDSQVVVSALIGKAVWHVIARCADSTTPTVQASNVYYRRLGTGICLYATEERA
jgi:hypothetical protein